jgi:hypothetical protein
VSALAREGLSSPFLSTEQAISISPCVGRLKVKEWPKERYSKRWAATPGLRQLKLFIGRPSDKQSWNGLGQETMQTGNRAVNWPLYIEMGFSESTKCRKCRQELESSYHILCQCPVLARHRLEIFSSAWL